MKPDGTGSSSAADGTSSISLKGINNTEPDLAAGSEGKIYSEAECSSWSYLFVHHSRVGFYEEQLSMDGMTYFVHKSVRYFPRRDKAGVQHKEVPTISGLIFLQGAPLSLQAYLNDNFPYSYLCKNCSTGRVAQIPDSRMRPFMRVSQIEPERIRFLLHPFHYYARNRILLRITSGELTGLEGYVIRIDRDRRLVMDVGGISVAVSGVHAEKFEEVGQGTPAVSEDSEVFYRRNLQERQALIDRYFHPVKTQQDITAQAASIAYLSEYVAAELKQKRMALSVAWLTFAFIIEEIAYYYAPCLERQPQRLSPIWAEGTKVLRQMESIISDTTITLDLKLRCENDYQRLLTQYGYLFS